MIVRAVVIAALATTVCLFSGGWGQVRAQVSFRGIPPARSVAESKRRLQQRIDRVLAYWAAQERGPFPRKRRHYGRFSWPAAAQMARGKQVVAINRTLLSAKARPFGEYGTRIRVVPGVCERSGDYDFMAQELVRLVYVDLAGSSRLWPSTLRKVATQLLHESGDRPRTRFALGMCGIHRETENHILMTESSRYLTNQLLWRLGHRAKRFANGQTGFDAWILRRLARPFAHHFEEYNAKPYQGYTVLALTNLHGFAEDPRVSRAAQMVLDYLAAVFAVQSNGLRRFPPFRRQQRYHDNPRVDDHDAETARFALLAGNYGFHEALGRAPPYGAHFMLAAALSDYRVPDPILDLIIDKSHNPYFQRLRHDNVEVYASSKSFLISAGGTFSRHFQYGSSEQHGWARPTLVIPTRDSHADARAWLRIEGALHPRRRNNTCVAPGFACGLNLVIPASIPDSCRAQHGRFTFLRFQAPACPMDYGFYAAVYREPCDSVRCRLRAGNYGFFEVREADELPFEDFVQRVLANNPDDFSARGWLRYHTSDGRRLVVEPTARDPERWPVVSIQGIAQERRFARWPLAHGDIIQAHGDGLVSIDNKYWGSHIQLDLRDPLRPSRRIWQRVPARPGPVEAGERPAAL